MADAVLFVLEPKNKELVLNSLSKGLRLPRPEDVLAVTTGSRISTSAASTPTWTESFDDPVPRPWE